MKKFLFIFIFVIAVLSCMQVYADDIPDEESGTESHTLQQEDVITECIYEDGGLYTVNYMGESGFFSKKFSVDRSTFNVAGADSDSKGAGASGVVINAEFSTYGLVNSLFTCPKNIHTEYLNPKDDEKSPERYYYFDENIQEKVKKKIEDAKKDSSVNWEWVYNSGIFVFYSDISAFKTDKLPFYTKNSYLLFNGKVKSKDTYDVSSKKCNLLSERYSISADYEPRTTVYYIRGSKEAEEKGETPATNAKEYIKVLVYDNVILLGKNGKVTRLAKGADLFNGVVRNADNTLSKNVPSTIYLNSPDPKSIVNSASTASYKFTAGQQIYSVSTTWDGVHTNEYILTDEILDGDEVQDEELCNEILPETSKQLKNVITWTRILIPIFLIVLTALDIGKIVVTGNIDEELPKRKKIITVRIVVVLIFFLLPVFIRMTIGWLKDSGGENTDNIKYIDCLFQ